MNKSLNIRKTIITVIVLNIFQIGTVIGFGIYEFVLTKGKINLATQSGELNLLFGIILIDSFMMLHDAYILNQVRYLQ